MFVTKPTSEFGKELLRTSLFFSLSLYARMFMKMFSGIIVAKLLGPGLFGLRNAYDLAIGYEAHSDLGVLSALNRQAPYYRGGNDSGKARLAISSVFGFSLIYASIAGIIMILVSQYLRMNSYAEEYVDFAFFFGIMIFTGKMHALLQTKFKIDQRFYALSVNQIFYGFTASFLSVVFVYLWSFRGLLISLLIADIVCIFYLLSKDKKIPEVKISYKLYWELLKIGFPIMILFLLLLLLGSADKTLILAMISERDLGYYGVASVATGVIATIPNAIHNVTIAPVMEKLGKTKDTFSIKNYFTEPMIVMAYLLPIIISCIYFSIHLPIEYYLLKYIPSIQVFKILMAAVYFEAVAAPSLSVSLALNKQINLVFLIGPLVIINFLINYMLIKLGWGINGVAFGTSTVFFIYFCVMLKYASVQFNENLSTYLKNFIFVLIPFCCSIVLLLCIEKTFVYSVTNIWSDIFVASGKIGVFIIVYSMIVYPVIRKHSGFVRIFGIILPIAQKLRKRSTGRKSL